MFADSLFSIILLELILGLSLSFLALSLLVVAAGLTALTIWFWISARPEPQSLAPLEVMGQRDFAHADDETRKQMLNAVRAAPVVGVSGAKAFAQNPPTVSAQVAPTVQGETK